MPYKNIVFVKLYLDLFDKDDRFLYQLNERQQLLYIKLLYLAGRQENKISKNLDFGKSKINYQGTTQQLLGDIKHIKKIFPKFTETKYYYTFKKFSELHNWLENGNSKGTPKEVTWDSQDKDKDKDKDKEEDKEGRELLVDKFFIKNWQRNPNISERLAVEKFTLEFTDEEITKAFRIAGEQNILKVSYVRGCLKKMREEKAKEKAKAEAEKKKQETKIIYKSLPKEERDKWKKIKL